MNWMLSFTSASKTANSDFVMGAEREAGDASIFAIMLVHSSIGYQSERI